MIISNLMKTRLEALSRIPFKAIITTNYNNCFVGKVATMQGELNETHFEEILRPVKDFQQGAQDSASKAEVLSALSPSPPRGGTMLSSSPLPETMFQHSRVSTPHPPDDAADGHSDISDFIPSAPASAFTPHFFHHKPDDPSGMTLKEARDKCDHALHAVCFSLFFVTFEQIRHAMSRAQNSWMRPPP
jgi:hypothetical protein